MKYILVEHKSNLNAILKDTCQFSQRIKFTCLDVSSNYIVFGATSGGLYIFKRYPHALLKLVPNKHGAVTQIAISPNEKSIALTTSRGIIVIISNCFTTNDFQYHSYLENKGSVITCIQWNNGELYYGNSVGKVGVITETNLLTKAIFQTPCAMLMQLDSSVCQMDCLSSLLLVSTLTRTYLCCTEKEQFIQIGKKLRNGNFGACFFTSIDTNEKTDDEQVFQNANDNTKVFCNRPGARLWEVQLDATVNCTHQLKDFFKQKINSWICLDDDSNPHSNILCKTEQKSESHEYLNFTKILVLQDRFLITYNNECFYVFDPRTLNVIYYNNTFNNIIDIKVAKNFIYVCLKNMEVNIFGLYGLENILLKTLFNQQYHACLEICTKYCNEILELVETSDRIHLLTVLESKVCQCFANGGIDHSLKLIFEALQNISKNKLSEKLNNGIVIVNNSYFNEQTLNDGGMLIEKADDNEELALQNNEANMQILLQQYEWTQINDRVKITKYKRLLDVININELVQVFTNFNQFMLEKDIDVYLWTYRSYLKYFATLNYSRLIESDIDDVTVQYVVEGYCAINYSHSCSCACSYPLPTANTNKPQFYEVGCALLKKLKATNQILYKQLITDVPYMWKYVVEFLRIDEDINVLLPILLQFNNEHLFTTLLNKFKYDTWDMAIKILIKLQHRKCINCGKKFDKDCVVINWTNLASYMVQSVGPQSTVNLLKCYAEFISSDDLDAGFYQSCIYAAAFGSTGIELKSHASLLNKTMANDAVQLEEVIAKYLSDRYRATSHNHTQKNVPYLKGQLL